jgi:hypothetical protein
MILNNCIYYFLQKLEKKTLTNVKTTTICSIPPLKVSLYPKLPVGEGFSFVHFTFTHRFSPTVFHSLVFIHP